MAERKGENGVDIWAEAMGSAPPHRAIRPPEEWGECEDGADGDVAIGRSELNFTLSQADRYQREKQGKGRG